MIHLDDYDFVIDLNFLNWINALLVSFIDCLCILDTHQQRCMVLVSHDEKDETKVLSTTKLVKNVHCGKNIDSVDRSATKTPLEKLEVRQTNVKFVKLSVRLPPMTKVNYAPNFMGKVVMQTMQSK